MSFVDQVVLFELSQSALCSRAFCNPVISPNASEHAFAKDFDRHSHTTSIRELFWFAVDENKFYYQRIVISKHV